ncbi:hypothetical protein D9M68_920780 [compost metagenome]
MQLLGARQVGFDLGQDGPGVLRQGGSVRIVGKAAVQGDSLLMGGDLLIDIGFVKVRRRSRA